MVFNNVCTNKDGHVWIFSFLCEYGQWTLAPAYDITYSTQGTRGEHEASVRYSGNPGPGVFITGGTGSRIGRKCYIVLIHEIKSVCRTELDSVVPLKPVGWYFSGK